MTSCDTAQPRRHSVRFSRGRASGSVETWHGLALALGVVAGCAAVDPAEPPEPAASPLPPAAETATFVDVAADVGLDFVHFNGMLGGLYYPEMMGAGGALFDYDDDGDLDVYLVQGAMLEEGRSPADAKLPPRHPLPLRGRLYRNDRNGDPQARLHFTDVTDASGIDAQGYGMGVATGDYDNDGRVDLYVTNLGPNQLYHNDGDGSFSDVTAASGTGDGRWSTSATFVDFDRDGWLDLYVANYVSYSLATHKACHSPDGRPDYCGPLSYESEPDSLFRNRGDGTFEDVSARSGIASEYSSGLGVVAADFDGDGWQDIYVANDGRANFLWLNQRDGRFRNVGLSSGTALNAQGMVEASMGVEAGDIDNDGDEDLFMTNLDGETNTLYVNGGAAFFEDRTMAFGLGRPSLTSTGFGTLMLDYDSDGWLDLLVVNGAVGLAQAVDREETRALGMRNQLFRNLGGNRFSEVTAQAGAVFDLVETSRGAVAGDVDEDGDADVLVTNNGGQVRLLINQDEPGQHWLGLRLVGARVRRDMLGARVGLELPGRATLWRRSHSDGSYCSAGDPRVLYPLGSYAGPARVRVRWPAGAQETFEGLPVDAYSTLVEGRGTAPAEVAP